MFLSFSDLYFLFIFPLYQKLHIVRAEELVHLKHTEILPVRFYEYSTILLCTQGLRRITEAWRGFMAAVTRRRLTSRLQQL